jgi:hypothetical protein
MRPAHEVSFRLSRIATRACLVVALLLTACSQNSTQATLTVNVSPKQVANNGQTTNVTVVATQANGQPGTGSVSVQVTEGSISVSGGGASGGDGGVTATLANGQASLQWSCDIATNPGCTGRLYVSATWNSVEGSSYANFTGPGLDAGGGRQDSGIADAGSSDAGVDAGTSSGPFMTLTASKSQIFFDVGDYSDLTAVLSGYPDGGQPLVGQTVTFTGSIGGFTGLDGGTPVSPYSTKTDGTGTALAAFTDTGTSGMSMITASGAGASASLVVNITPVKQIQWSSTLCTTPTGSIPCTLMGVKGSGFQEVAQVNFLVLDTNGVGAPGVDVAFSIQMPPTGTTISPTGVTNAQGQVTANVSSGTAIGSFSVTATVIPGQVFTNSDTISVVGALPSNQGFSLQCSPVNIGAYISATPPAAVNVTCTVALVDRFNNPVGTGTPVSFKVEAGAIPNSVNTQAYSPTGNNANEGQAQVQFTTLGGTPFPVDVTPFPANANQAGLPNLAAEPSIQPVSGGIIYNPRDGLVSVLAYVSGEEYFDDLNQSGVYAAGDPFIDQGEPFVDSNDDGIQDNGELYIDVNGNGKWDPPNGVWDGHTTIWTEARILYTGAAKQDVKYSYLVPDPYASPCVTAGTMVNVQAYFGDQNLNRVQANSTSFTASFPSGSQGSIDWETGGLLDSYGFNIQRTLVGENATSLGAYPSALQACNPNSSGTICIWKMIFYGGWSVGYSGYATIQADSSTTTNACQSQLATVQITTEQVTTLATATGEVQ